MRIYSLLRLNFQRLHNLAKAIFSSYCSTHNGEQHAPSPHTAKRTERNRSQLAITVVHKDLTPDLATPPPPSESLIRYLACILAQTPHDYFNPTYFLSMKHEFPISLRVKTPYTSSANVQKPSQEAYWFKLHTRVPLTSKNQPKIITYSWLGRPVQNGDIRVFFRHVHSTANSSISFLLKGQSPLTEPFDSTFLNEHISHPSEKVPRIKCLNSHCDYVGKILITHMTQQNANNVTRQRINYQHSPSQQKTGMLVNQSSLFTAQLPNKRIARTTKEMKLSTWISQQ